MNSRQTHKRKHPLLSLALAGLTLGSLTLSSAQAGVLYFDYNRTIEGATLASVFLFGNAGQAVNISNLAGFNTNVILDANGAYNLGISTLYEQIGTGVHNTGFKIVSADPLGGIFFNREPFTSDAALLIEEANLGTHYVVASHGDGMSEGSQIMVHATQDNTDVTLQLATGGVVAVTLQAGETYKYVGGDDELTGSRVSASAKVAVFGGHACANVPVDAINHCDVMIEQMMPNEALSSLYHVSASHGASVAPSGADLFKIIASEDNTAVSIDGVVVANLDAGEVHQFDLLANTGATIESSAPVMVAQYLVGGEGTETDPSMALVPGADAWLKSYQLATPDGAAAFDYNFASVVINTADLATLMLNGVLVDTNGFSAIASTGFSRGLVDLPWGLFNLAAANPFLMMLGGNSLADSYLTFGGSTFAPGFLPPVAAAEPASLALFGLGGLMLSFSRRRGSRARQVTTE